MRQSSVLKFVGLAALMVAVSACSPDLPATPTEPTWPTSSASTSAGPTAVTQPSVSTTVSTTAGRPAAKTPSKAAATAKTKQKLKLSCEPEAPARLVGNTIVNKDCPDLIASKERAQREYAEEQLRQESEAALRSCREQTGMSTEECIADAEAGDAS